MGAARLEPYAAVWCVPASPHENTQGVIDAIRFARLQKRPFLGTCGGFQHALLEYAQAVWGIDAMYAETSPDPFFIGTLFQPERAALRGQTPPLVQAFVEAVA